MNRYAWAAAVAGLVIVVLMAGPWEGRRSEAGVGGASGQGADAAAIADLKGQVEELKKAVAALKKGAGAGGIVVMDEAKFLQDTDTTRKMNANLDKARTQANDALRKTQTLLTDKVTVLQWKLDQARRKAGDSAVPPASSTQPDEVTRLQQQIIACNQIYQRAVQMKDQQIQAYNSDMVNRFRLAIQPTLQGVAASKGLNVIVSKGSTIYAEPDSEVTQDLVKALLAKTPPELGGPPALIGEEVDISDALKQIGL